MASIFKPEGFHFMALGILIQTSLSAYTFLLTFTEKNPLNSLQLMLESVTGFQVALLFMIISTASYFQKTRLIGYLTGFIAGCAVFYSGYYLIGLAFIIASLLEFHKMLTGGWHEK